MFKLFDNKNADEIAVLIEKEKVKLEDLFLGKEKDREAFKIAIKNRPALLAKITDSEKGKALLKYAIDLDPSNFIYLKKEQYTESLAQKFLLFRLNEIDKYNKQTKTDAVSVQTSLDDKVLLNYSYASQDGDEVNYFDNELQVPASLKYCFKATLKIVNALTLIDKIDLHVTQLGKNKIKNTLTDIFDNKFKAFISEYLSNKKVGYYSLCANVDTVEASFKQNVKESFEPYGIELGEFIIKKFAIPKDIQNRIEDQYFRIRQQKEETEATNELAKKSLELYESKLAIENKYPEGIHSLTEYEKDLALKRYLVKNGFNPDEEVDRKVDVENVKDKADYSLDKKQDVIPEPVEETNVAKTAYVISMVIAIIISIIVFATNVNTGLILFGVLVAVFGLIGIAFYDKINKTEKPNNENEKTNQGDDLTE
ncbi:MAG: SPFH domain-containing protein [Clostridia bacterium]|nr:SPFH domain-containing protein [Clostridia bacterium]